MKINYINRGLIIILAMVVIGGATIGIIKLNSPEKRMYSMNWTEQQETFDEAYQNADSVIIGKVRGMETYEDKMVVFTMAEIETIEVLKGNVESACNVLFTGGTLNGIIYEGEECKIPSKDEVYLFLLKNRENEGEYIPIGGYQGVFELDYKPNKNVSKDIKIREFNKNNRLEKNIVDKTVKDVINNNHERY